ncbi:MAG: SH3 domain-containing protein [Clostridia bacterium]|nr:SH3 domain-containing protein [Clostridia bacterium]
MFCPNCGIKMDDGAVFCGNCGFNVAESEGAGETALLLEQPPVNFVRNNPNMAYYGNQPAAQPVQNNMQQSPQNKQEAPKKEKKKGKKQPEGKKKKKTGLIVTLILLFLAFAFVALGVVGLVVGSFFVTPKAQAESFADELIRGEPEGIYDMLFGDDAIVTYDEFETKYNNDGFALSVFKGEADYQVAIISEGETTSTYTVTFTDGNSITFDVEKVKDGFWYFDEYQIVSSICPSYDVYIPDGAQLFINDIEVTSEPEVDVFTGLNKYRIAPLLVDEYNLKVQYMERTYEKNIYVLEEAYYNTITIDADDIEYGSTIKEASAYTTEDAEEFFGRIMNEYTFNTYRVFYYGTPTSLLTYGIESIAPNDYRLYKGDEYNSEIEDVKEGAAAGILASDIMSEEEYNTLSSAVDGYKVYKLSEVQDKINSLWGTGAVNVASLINESDVVTSKGFLLREGENDDRGNFDYYGKVKSSKLDKASNQVVVKAYILKCDVENKKIYDEGTGLQIAVGQVNRGAGVDFDAIVSELNINTDKLSTVSFSFQLSDNGVTLLGAMENAVSKDVLNAQNVVLENYEKTCYMKVKADGGLNMRYEPTDKSQVIKLIPNNSAIEVRGYSSNVKDWVYVYWGGYEGWVSYKYLTPAQYTSQPSGDVYWYKVKADGGLNMRNKDNQKGTLVKLIPDKSYVKLICYNADGTWAYVIYSESYAGWVNTAYIKAD